MAQKDKRVVVPIINVRHNEDDTGFSIDVDLAGAKKRSVELEMGTAGFCVKGEGDDFRYESCYVLAHDVKPEAAEAKQESGLLKIRVPFRETMRGHKVKIES
ncbi:MAG: Hsp20/alpha crystallin family protein [Planctomycetota bacterium]